jgi:hypothetical protein
MLSFSTARRTLLVLVLVLVPVKYATLCRPPVAGMLRLMVLIREVRNMTMMFFVYMLLNVSMR